MTENLKYQANRSRDISDYTLVTKIKPSWLIVLLYKLEFEYIMSIFSILHINHISVRLYSNNRKCLWKANWMFSFVRLHYKSIHSNECASKLNCNISIVFSIAQMLFNIVKLTMNDKKGHGKWTVVNSIEFLLVNIDRKVAKMIEKQKDCEISAKNTPDRSSSSVAGLPGPASLTDDALEKLYRSYSLKQKRSGLSCFIVGSIVFDLWAIVVPQGQSKESLGELTFVMTWRVSKVLIEGQHK